MTAQATTFHHVGLITHDMDQTISRYQQLGFFFTPLSLPRIVLQPGRAPEPFGAGNRTAIFEENYLEVLAHTDLSLWNSTTPQQRGPYNLDVPLARYKGMHVMHFGTDDLVALHDRLAARGVTCTGIRPFERTVDSPSGPQMMKALAFSFPPEASPEGLVQIAQHLTPELVLQPRFMRHPNGARLVTESIVCARDPEQYARKYSLYTGFDYQRTDGWFEVRFGARSRVIVVTPEQAGRMVPGGRAPAVPGLIGFTVLVADLDHVAEWLTGHGVPFQAFGTRLVVAAADACGCAVRFEE
jgi:catechol 2,3-dioxygenase-like lactoylglutathione lyase family enzyme